MALNYSQLLNRNFKSWRLGLCLICYIFIGQTLQAQVKSTDGNPKKISIHSEDNQVIDAREDPPTQYLNGNVQVYHSGAYMYCDTAILKGSDLRMYFNVVILQNDTIKIFADSLRYDGDSLFAYLYGDIILENGPNKKLYTSYLEYDVKNKIGYYTQNAKLVDGTSTLISKQGKYYLNDKTAYFYENVQVLGDDFELVGDSLAYNTTTQRADFLSPVRIKSDTSQIYSERGWFNLGNKIGDFIGNAQYESGKTKAKSDTISYDGQLDQVTLKSIAGRSEYISEKDTAYAKVIYYDKANDIFTLTKDAHYKSEQNEVKGNEVFYDKKTEKFKVTGRSYISDPPSIIEADTLDYNKSIKLGIAHGNVIWRDTSAKTAIHADHVLYRGEENFMKATNDVGRPLFTSEVDGDTLFIKADTLKSFRVIKERIIYKTPNEDKRARNQKTESKVDSTLIEMPGLKLDTSVISTDTSLIDTFETQIQEDTIYTGIMDTIDYFVGDNNVKMFKSNMQSVCDSLIFNKTDSLFTLSQNPFVWSDSSQIAGDTIDIKMKDKKIDRLIVRSNATIISTEDLLYFNQIRGRFLEAFFKESKIYRMDLDGNAQIVYYLVDDEKAYIGVNTTESSNMSFYLNENKITDIRCYKEPTSKLIPMKDADHEALKVKGFIWNIAFRPLRIDDL
jgi:lipopolysaccharide transport protein LptA